MSEFAYVFAWSYLTGFLLVLTIRYIMDTDDEDS